VLPKYKTVIFVHGCFWHRHEGCRYAYTPKTRKRFWGKKFAENVERDRIARYQLKRAGWRVAVVWECQLRSPASRSSLRGEEGHIATQRASPTP
jgi:DNA mismatch endonuclease (patch repair protein)